MCVCVCVCVCVTCTGNRNTKRECVYIGCTHCRHGCELLVSEDLVKLFVNPPVVGLGPRGQQELEGSG